VIVVGLALIVVSVAMRDHSSTDAPGTTVTQTQPLPTDPRQAAVPAGSTAPTTPKGLGVGFAPEHRGRRALRGFSEVTATITSGSGETCEVCLLAAATEAQRERGLMGVTDRTLGGYDGMVFLYAQPAGGAFWMRNTPMPLSIAYFDGKGRLLSTADMDPCADVSSCRSYPSGGAFRYALEVPEGKLADVSVNGKATIEIHLEHCPLRKAG
jgi:uncharacterized membrane protein (UPF0127 family)